MAAPVSKKPTEFRFSGGSSLLPEAGGRVATHESTGSDGPAAAARAAAGVSDDVADETFEDASAHRVEARPIGKLGAWSRARRKPYLAHRFVVPS